jgi:hypothetical protein
MVVARRSAYTAWNASSGKTVNSAQIERRLMAIPAADHQRQGRSGPTDHGPVQLPHYLVAAETCDGVGETGNAWEYSGPFENVMRTLAQNFTAADRSRSSLLRALETK